MISWIIRVIIESNIFIWHVKKDLISNVITMLINAYGTHCQLSKQNVGLPLDAIFGYQIQPKFPFSRQSYWLSISSIITIIMFVLDLVNSILSFISFSSKSILVVGCGVYFTCCFNCFCFYDDFSCFEILFSSCFSIITMVENRIFLLVQCLSLDFFS